MNITSYPVTTPYRSTDYPYSKDHPHKGIDYGLYYNPIMIEGTQVAVSGNTGEYKGMTYDPHLHVQAGRDEWAQNDINPTPYVGKSGKVVKTGWADQWGNYICIQVGDVNVFYCHLSKIMVTVGQEVGGDMPLTQDQQDRAFRMALLRVPSVAERDNQQWRNNPGLLIDTLWNNGGKQNYSRLTGQELVKQDIDNLLKDAGITPTQADYNALKMGPKDFAYYLQKRLKNGISPSGFQKLDKDVYVKK